VFSPPLETEIFLRKPLVARYRILRLRQAAAWSGKSLLVEKTPRHLHKIAKIRQYVPDARFIVTVRDGRDVVASLAARMGGDIEKAMRRWVTDTTATAKVVGAPDVLLVRYEDFIDDPARTLTGICDFLGIDYSPELLDYHRQPKLWYGRKEIARETEAKDNRSRRNWQVNQPIFDGRGRWRQELTPETVAQFREPPARGLMETFGYTPD
jgi:hypothetical protein